MSVAWVDSAMSSSHGTVTDCRDEELKTKGTNRRNREAHTRKVRSCRMWCVWTLRCGEGEHRLQTQSATSLLDQPQGTQVQYQSQREPRFSTSLEGTI